MNGLRILMNCF